MVTSIKFEKTLEGRNEIFVCMALIKLKGTLEGRNKMCVSVCMYVCEVRLAFIDTYSERFARVKNRITCLKRNTVSPAWK